MDIAEAKYQVAQILAEARVRGLPMLQACIAAAHFLDKNGFELPASILDWLSDAELTPRTFH